MLKQKKDSRIFKISFQRIAVAASVALVFAFGIDQLMNVPDPKVEMAEADILNYYEDHVDELDYELLVELDQYANGTEEILTDDLTDEELEYYVSDIIDEFTIEEIYETTDI